MDSKLSERIRSQNSFGSIFLKCHRWVQCSWRAVSGAGGSQAVDCFLACEIQSLLDPRAWQCTPVIPEPGRWWQEDQEFQGRSVRWVTSGPVSWPEFCLQDPHSRSRELHIYVTHSRPPSSTCALLKECACVCMSAYNKGINVTFENIFLKFRSSSTT